MKQFIVLAVAATLFGLVIAQGYSDDDHIKKDDSYSSHSGRYGSGYRRYGGYQHQGYGYGYKKCPKLADPENGSVKHLSYSLRPGSKAVHFCNVGHILNGDKVRVCRRDGTWSGEAPTCDPVDCGTPDAPDDNGSVTYVATTFNNTATYSCNAGYYVDTVRGGSEIIVCLANGEWSDTAPACKAVDCGHPPAQNDNGDVVFTGTTFTNTATYTCDSGYVQTGGNLVVFTCQANGDWSGSTAPDCTPVNCGPVPAADPNGAVASATTTFRSIASYSCNLGFILDTSNGGSVWIECQYNGIWSGTAAGCVRIDCCILLSPENGVVDLVPDSLFESEAEYSCIRGYKLVGASSRTCQANGEWSSTAPVCERISCPDLEDPENGKVIVSGNYVDDKAVYRCAYGFVLSGDYKRVCQEDGTWSGSDPTCDYEKHDYGHDGYGDRHYGRYDSKKDY